MLHFHEHNSIVSCNPYFISSLNYRTEIKLKTVGDISKERIM